MQSRKLIFSGILLFGFALGIIAHPLVGKVLAQVASTEIYACVKDNGLVRISTTSTTCGTGETLLSWNTQGPAGPQGPQGPEGPQGPIGPAGSGGIGEFDPAMFKDHLIENYANFAYRNWDNVDFSNSLFSVVSLHLASFRNANFTNIIYVSWLTGSRVTGDFTGANFTGAKFMSQFGMTFYYQGDFTNANFTNANMHYAGPETRYGVGPITADGRTNFSQSNFTGAIWSNTICPDDTNSDNNGGTCEGHLVSL